MRCGWVVVVLLACGKREEPTPAPTPEQLLERRKAHVHGFGRSLLATAPPKESPTASLDPADTTRLVIGGVTDCPQLVADLGRDAETMASLTAMGFTELRCAETGATQRVQR